MMLPVARRLVPGCGWSTGKENALAEELPPRLPGLLREEDPSSERTRAATASSRVRYRETAASR